MQQSFLLGVNNFVHTPAGYFTFWVILSLIWGLVATVIATLLPIWEARASLISMCMHLVGRGGDVGPKDHPPLNYPGPEQFKEVQLHGADAKDDTAHGPQYTVV